MNKIVITEKFVKTCYPQIVEEKISRQSTGLKSKHVNYLDKENLLEANGVNLEHQYVAVKSPYVNRHRQELVSSHKVLQKSLNQPLNNFLRSCSRNHTGSKNTNLSNYTLYGSLKRLPKLGSKFFEQARQNMQRANDKYAQVLNAQTKHMKKLVEFDVLKRRVSQVYLQKHQRNCKKAEEYSPKVNDYLKEYLVKPSYKTVGMKNKRSEIHNEDVASVDKRSMLRFSSFKTKYIIGSKNSTITVSSPKKEIRESINDLNGSMRGSVNPLGSSNFMVV